MLRDIVGFRPFFQRSPEVHLDLPLAGIDVQVLDKLEQPVTATVTFRRTGWIFPACRLLELEAKDEVWCRYFGIGREGAIDETLTLKHAVIDLKTPGTLKITGVDCSLRRSIEWL
jgi:hypothetical protein